MSTYGLTFKGKHSFKDFKLVMVSKNRPILPEPKIVSEDVQGMDGEYDFYECNPEGRIKYKPRIMEVEFSIKERDPVMLRIKAHEIARWLSGGESQLIFDDETAVYHLAKVSNKLDLETQITSIKQFTVQFKCRPYSYSVVKSNEQLSFGQGLMLGYGYKLDMIPLVFNVNAAQTLNFYNPGDFVKPSINIQGFGTNIRLTSNGKSLLCGSIFGETLDISCDKMQATKNGTNILNSLSGEFLSFENGENSLVINGSNLDFTITIIFNYKNL